MTYFEFDDDGYPSEASLGRIREWDIIADLGGLIDFVIQGWSYPEYVRFKDGLWSLATGGWSGNEDIITALQLNSLFWAVYWWSSTRGGRFEFSLYGAMDRA